MRASVSLCAPSAPGSDQPRVPPTTTPPTASASFCNARTDGGSALRTFVSELHQ